jgi:hypothetical protein
LLSKDEARRIAANITALALAPPVRPAATQCQIAELDAAGVHARVRGIGDSTVAIEEPRRSRRAPGRGGKTELYGEHTQTFLK